ncbi:MAG: ABC transporter ATP-binding protein [Nitrospirota bacterium]
MIKLANVSKTYKDGDQTIHAVLGASMEVAAGDFVSVMGHSGSGKTTLLSLMGGLTKPEAGKVTIGGTDIWSLPDDELSAFRNQNVNFIFQFASLVPTLTVFENVLLPTAFGKPSEGLEDRARSLVEMVGLKDKINSYPSRLSGGQQRRVAIARAFINSPKVVLADEPTGDLDEATESEIMAIFKKKCAEGTTFIIVTHNSSIASAANSRYRMSAGRLEKIEGA